MARVLFELVVLVAIVSAILYSARRWDNQRRGLSPASPRALAAPPDATWSARHQGTRDEQTEVVVILRSPGSNQIWDSRVCQVIPNRDPDYDKRLYNAMEDARARALLLNSLREG